METGCQDSWPLNSENARPPGTYAVYLSWATISSAVMASADPITPMACVSRVSVADVTGQTAQSFMAGEKPSNPLASLRSRFDSFRSTFLALTRVRAPLADEREAPAPHVKRRPLKLL
jgi:hypothetical protein